jgi:hypothetical protein
MEDVNISIYRASVVREGSTPASPGFVVSEGQNPTDPAGSGQNHLPVTIATAATGLSITESQVLGGAGTVGQYIRGDGSLADFPESSGGGSSVSYYLNGSVSQGTIGGVAYKELNKVPILGAGTDFTINADGYIASFITDAGDPNLLEIPGGNWNFETYFSSSSSGGTPSFYVELYKYDGSTFTLLASNSTFPEFIAFGTIITPYFSTLAVPTTTLALTDRLAIRYYVTHSGRTITLHTEDNHLCQIVTTFTTGITALNGLTAQVQNFAVGTSGTDFNIASATATHTFNLPTASATNRGALSSADWTTFNGKTSNLGTVTSVGLSSATSGVTIGSTPVTTSGTITLAIATASGSQNGLLSSTDWTTFNSKQNALTNPVTGTGTTNYLPKFTGASTIGNSVIQESGGLIGIGSTPSYLLNVISVLDGSLLEIKSTATANNTALRIGIDANNAFINATGGSTGILEFRTYGSTKAIITQTGNVLIGNPPAADNGARLQLSGFSGAVNQNNGIKLTNTAGTIVALEIGASNDSYIGTLSGSKFSIRCNNTSVITVDTALNVGIGTTSPNLSAGSAGSSILTVSATISERNGILELNGTRTTNTFVSSYVRFFNNGAATPLAEIRSIRGINDTSGDLSIETSGAERVRVTSNGLTFNGDTAAANALDDYEEGTWTPTITGGYTGITYSFQNGWYRKIGSAVIVSGRVSFTGTANGAGISMACPFTQGPTGYASGGIPYSDIAVITNTHPYLTGGSSSVLFYTTGTGVQIGSGATNVVDKWLSFVITMSV